MAYILALDPVWGRRIDALRALVETSEVPQFTRDYHDPAMRSIANSLRLVLKDGTELEETVEYPIGHKRRRAEGMPLLVEKFRRNLAREFEGTRRLSAAQQARILEVSMDQKRLEAMPVNEYVEMYQA